MYCDRHSVAFCVIVGYKVVDENQLEKSGILQFAKQKKIQDFHRNYVSFQEDKAANNVVVVWRLHYINTLKQELGETKSKKISNELQISVDAKSVPNDYSYHTATKFAVSIKEDQDGRPML